MKMGEAVDHTPLLAGSQASSLKPAISECKLVDKCFLSDGAAAKSSAGFKKVQRKLVIACILCFIFMTVEVIGGYIANSVAIMSDAAHMLSDVSAFLVSIFATWAATQPSSWHYSFGYHRAEILGALISVLTIWAVTGALVFEAFQRVINPVEVDGKLMFIIAVAGVVFNILVGLALGVHAHLGHSHGPGGCSHGHDHQHDHGHDHDHDHDHSHGHSHGGCNHDHDGGSKHSRSHSHGEGSKHTHSNGESKEQRAAGCCGHKHDDGEGHQHHHNHGEHEHGNGDHCHSHDHSDDEHHSHSEAESEAGHSSDDKHGEHCRGHTHGHGAATATTVDSVVINLPAAAPGLDRGASCGLDGHALTCKCTISKVGSREIEVRCELPAPAERTASSGAAASKARQSSHTHSHGGHGHSHSHGDDAGSINLRSAVLHVIGDLLQSVGVAIAGALIWYNQHDPRWNLADPICTFVFSIVVLLTTKSILRDIVHVLMERTPTNMDIPAVAKVMLEMDGIWDVHDLHVWNISTSMKPVLTAHVHIGPDADANVVLQQLEQYVRGLGIDHSTIQICNIQAQPEAPETQEV